MNNDKDFLDFTENIYPAENEFSNQQIDSNQTKSAFSANLDKKEIIKGALERPEFEDSLVLKNIKPAGKISYSANRIPADYVTESGEKIEISDDISYINDPSKKRSNLIVHRNSNDEITKLEVICTCGEHTVIKLDFSDNSEEAEK